MFTPLIEKLQRRQDLTTEEAAAAMDRIMEGQAQPSQIAALLVGLAMKGERPAEVRPGFENEVRSTASDQLQTSTRR